MKKYIVLLVLIFIQGCSSGDDTTLATPPSISNFTSSPATITVGEDTTLAGVFANGAGSIDANVGPVTSGVDVVVTPTITTTYTLTVTNATGASISAQVTVTVIPAPSITSFAGSRTITVGEDTTLTGVFAHGTGSIDANVGPVTSGVDVVVTPTIDTTYTLTVTNVTGASISEQVTVTVIPAPSITSFAGSRTITVGEDTTLTGVFAHGTGSIDANVGPVTSGVDVVVTPTIDTTYTLTVTNATGASISEQVTVTVIPAPSITSFAGSRTITVGEDTTLTGVFAHGTGSIDANVGPVTSGVDVVVTPTIDTTYTLTVTNVTGASISEQVTVTVIPAPSITSFAGSRTITVGEDTTLTGVFAHGTGSIDANVGLVNSDVDVVVKPTITTIYTLTVTNETGASISEQVKVTVIPAPSITSFIAGGSIIAVGEDTTLTGVFANGTGSIDANVGPVNSDVDVVVKPTITTTYTLTVTNETGASISEQVTVTVESVPGLAAKNIILFIGDGMGAEHRKAARWASVGDAGKLSMDDMLAIGSLQTHSADNVITDSAAGATAMATGVKTNNGVIGLDANLSFVSTILENSKSYGKFVGLVTTTHISNATPAAFAAHVESRYFLNDIAEQMLVADINVLIGGGEDEFLPASENGCFPNAGGRSDGRNLINEFIAIEYVYTCDPVSFGSIEPSSTFKLIALFADEGMTRPFSPTLADMTQKAIDILSKNSDGFFLMVEGGQIDWASHSNDATNAIADTIGFDEAVEVAKQFASKTNDTLIIVTADHETGGMVVSSSPSGLPDEDGPFSTPDGKLFYVNWSTTGHTEANVPVTSQGPLSDMLNGVHDNTFIYDVMLSAFGGG